ncbi:4Fe-4S binding protein [Candidatus Fermentibacteria bacterium]|nr:4Fe-4S binding protein [Candidatus Fermentibacteria bacterium]
MQARREGVREIAVISGKGGTGKTSFTASFAVLARGCVMADCDVDAADMHLLLAPETVERNRFLSGNKAFIRKEACNACGRCVELCRFGAVRVEGGSYSVDSLACEGCGLCVRFCPAGAIDFPVCDCGEWMVSRTRAGKMVHARLTPGAENSGRLVSLVRKEARKIAEGDGTPLVLVDGPPGIGCPVIASVTGASLAVIVTEPTMSGAHDLERVLSLTGHFGIPCAVCVNKWDINPEVTALIEASAEKSGARAAGRVGYDPGVTRAMVSAKTVVETDCAASADISAVWKAVCTIGGFDG